MNSAECDCVEKIVRSLTFVHEGVENVLGYRPAEGEPQHQGLVVKSLCLYHNKMKLMFISHSCLHL